jgi:hypothetical protein
MTVKYVCDCVSKTGERCTVIVTLDDYEIDDAQQNYRTAELVARGYVMRKASYRVPAGFSPDLKSIQQIQLH